MGRQKSDISRSPVRRFSQSIRISFETGSNVYYFTFRTFTTGTAGRSDGETDQ